MSSRRKRTKRNREERRIFRRYKIERVPFKWVTYLKNDALTVFYQRNFSLLAKRVDDDSREKNNVVETRA